MTRTLNSTVSCSTLLLALLVSQRTAMGADPLFTRHIIDDQLGFIGYRGLHSALADVNGDRKLDFIVSNAIDRIGRWPNVEGWTVQFDLYEYAADDRWNHTTLRRETTKSGGAVVSALQVGHSSFFSDLVLSDGLLVNKNGTGWTHIGGAQLPLKAHDVLPFDLDNDQKTDLAYLYADQSGRTKIAWYKQGTPYSHTWEEFVVDTDPQAGNGGTIHGGLAPGGVCDLNGDTYPDLVAPGLWYENPGSFTSRAAPWKKHFMTTNGGPSGEPLIGQRDFQWGYMVRSWCTDMDGDGDEDIVQSEGDYRESVVLPGNGRIGWLENSGDGHFETVHWIKNDRALVEPPHDFHSLGVFDYDADGDMDVVSADGALPHGLGNRKAVYIFENTTPRKVTKPTQQYWKQHTVLLGHECHDAKLGDVNGDQKIDIVCRGYEYNDLLNPIDPPYLFLKNETP